MPTRDVFVRSLPVSVPQEGARGFTGTPSQLKLLKSPQMLGLLVERFVHELEPLTSGQVWPVSVADCCQEYYADHCNSELLRVIATSLGVDSKGSKKTVAKRLVATQPLLVPPLLAHNWHVGSRVLGAGREAPSSVSIPADHDPVGTGVVGVEEDVAGLGEVAAPLPPISPAPQSAGEASPPAPPAAAPVASPVATFSPGQEMSLFFQSMVNSLNSTALAVNSTALVV